MTEAPDPRYNFDVGKYSEKAMSYKFKPFGLLCYNYWHTGVSGVVSVVSSYLQGLLESEG